MSPSTPPAAYVTPYGATEDHAPVIQHTADEADNAPKKEQDKKKTPPQQTYSWRHYYVKPSLKDFSPTSRLQDRLDNAPPPPPRRFQNATPGEIMLTLLREAHARGAVPEIRADFTAAKDSAGNKWPTKKEDMVSHKFNAGDSLLSVAQWLDQEGFAEVRMHGRTLQMFDPANSQDLTGSVILAQGKNLIDSPSKGDARTMATDVYVISDNGVHGWTGDPKSREKYGRIEVTQSISTVRKWDEAESRGQRYLQKHKDPKQQRTFGIVPDTGADPYKDFNIGDFITVVQSTTPEKVRVRQIGLSWDQNGIIAVAITTSDIIEPFAKTVKKQLTSLAGKSFQSTSAGASADDLAFSDGIAPETPSTPKVTSVAGSVGIYWDGKDFTGAAPVFDQAYVEVHASTDQEFDPTVYTLIDTLSTGGTVFRNDFAYNVDTFIKFVAVDKGGDRSDPSEEVRTNMSQVGSSDLAPGSVGSTELDPSLPLGSDGAPPSSAPTGVQIEPFAIGALRISWLAVDNHDPVTYEVFASDTTGVDEGDFLVASVQALSAVVGHFAGARLDYSVAYHFVVRATDEDGPGPLSAEVSGSPSQAATGDIAADTVEAFQINAAQIVAGNMAADVSVTGSIFIASFDDEGNPIPDTVSGQWAPDGFRMYDLTGNEKVAFDPNSDYFKFGGVVEATHMQFENASMMGFNQLAEGGVIALESGVTPPTTPLSVATTVDFLQYETPGAGFKPAGMALEPSSGDVYICWNQYSTTFNESLGFSVDATYAFVCRHSSSDGSIISTGSVFGDDVSNVFCTAYDPGTNYVYVIMRLLNGNYWVQRVNGTTLSPTGRSQWPHADGVRQPAIGWDATAGEIMIAQARQSTDTVRVRHYTFNAGGTLTNGTGGTIDYGSTYAEPLRAILRGSFDLGATRYLFMRHDTGFVQSMNTSGVEQTGDEWPARCTLAGLYWDGTNFFSIDDGGLRRKYEAGAGNKWTTSTDGTWHASSTLYWLKQMVVNTSSGSPNLVATSGTFFASDVGSPITGTGIPGGTHILSVTDTTHAVMDANASATNTGVTVTMERETPRGPVVNFNMTKRSKLIATMPSLPANATPEPTGARLYLTKGSSVPTAGTMHLQGVDSSDPPTLTISNANFSGAADPTVTTFSQGVLAEVQNAIGETLLRADYAANRTYTPVLTGTVTNPTLGSGPTVLSRWGRGSDGMVHGSFVIQFGTGMGAGSGFYQISLPTDVDATAMITNQTCGSAVFIDATGVDYAGSLVIVALTTAKVGLLLADLGRLSAVNPVVPNDTDKISGEFHYWPA